MTCANCGAIAAAGAGRFCSHCGGVLADAPRIRADEYRTHPERFAAVRGHAGYPDAMLHDPGRGVSILEFIAPGFMILFGAVFFTAWMAAGPDEMRIVGVLFMVAWFGTLGAILWRTIAAARAPLAREVAVVVNTRTQLATHRHDGRRHTTTSYYVTLQGEDGARGEYSVRAPLAGLVTTPDIGVAYVRGRRLLDFRRFDA